MCVFVFDKPPLVVLWLVFNQVRDVIDDRDVGESDNNAVGDDESLFMML